MMADLRGFTSTCEALRAELVVRMLNAYLGAMAEVVARHRGTVIEFIGDAVLAVFGAPLAGADDAARAVTCAVAMQHALVTINRDNAVAGLPALEMGVALHTGEVVVGNIGSAARVKYGVVGSHVNLTARIEAMSTGGQVLISEATRAAAAAAVVVGARLELSAKGFAQTITAWDLLGTTGPQALAMPALDDDLHELSEPVAVSFSQVTDKLVDQEVEWGRLILISTRCAVLETPARLAALANLRLRAVDSAGVEIPSDLWAKVVGASAGSVTLRFPPPPAAIAELFAARIAAAI
jgi:class 3 adenylate cyclase